MNLDSNHSLVPYDERRHQLSTTVLQPNLPDEEFIDLKAYWHILVRHRFTILVITLIVLIVVTIYTAMQTPIYRSSVSLQIEKKSVRILQYQDVLPEEQGYSFKNEFLKTQIEILKSKKLAQRVIESLELSPEQLLPKSKPSLLKRIQSLFKKEASTDKAPNLENFILKNMQVKPVRDTRIVVVSFEHSNPVLAAKIANAIAESFIALNLERRFESSSYAKKFLEERIKQVRAELEDAEQKLLEYAGDRQIIDLDQKQSGLLAKINALNSKLVEAQARRIRAQSIYDEMKSSNMAGFNRVLNDPVIQTYKEQLVQLQSEYEENLKIYKPAYPKMRQLQSSIAQVKAKLEAEMNYIRSSVQSEYKAAVREEKELQAQIQAIKQQILDLQANSTRLQVLKRNVDTNQELYHGLLQRLKEVDVTAGIMQNNIAIVDKAEIPDHPYKPNLKKNLLIALVLGLIAGIGIAFLLEYLDDTIQSVEDIEKLGISSLGMVPQVVDEDHLPALLHFDPTAAFSEAHRSLRTALSFSTPQGAPEIIHLTSSVKGEGKTTTAVSLAIAYAQSNQRVLIIDADLRNPSVHDELNLSNEKGLSHYLTTEIRPGQLVQKTNFDGLWLMSSGPIPPNPAELLASQKMIDLLQTAADKFDRVIVDAPPVLGLADAMILANISQATLLVIKSASTRRDVIKHTIQKLYQAQAKLIGAVLTQYSMDQSSYGYHYYGYGYGDRI